MQQRHYSPSNLPFAECNDGGTSPRFFESLAFCSRLDPCKPRRPVTNSAPQQPYARLLEFYEAVMPQLEAMPRYLNSQSLDALPRDAAL